MGKPQVEGHWHSLIEGFSTSSLDFCELVKAGIARREIPDLKISQPETRVVAARKLQEYILGSDAVYR